MTTHTHGSRHVVILVELAVMGRQIFKRIFGYKVRNDLGSEPKGLRYGLLAKLVSKFEIISLE